MKISILTPSFNSAEFIQQSIESVLIQNYTDWEHIIVDGGSSDDTVEILKKYNHIKWVSEKDNGQSDAMNKAFEMCTGDIIVYLNSDDIFYSGAFESVVNEFKENPSIDIVVGGLMVSIPGEKEYVIENITLNWKDLSILQKRYPQNPVSYFYKKEVQEKVGKFPVNEHYAMDYWFLLRALYLFKAVKITPVLGCFIHREDNKTTTLLNSYYIVKSIALKFCLRYTPWRFPYVYKVLFLDTRNFTFMARQVKKILFKFGLNYYNKT